MIAVMNTVVITSIEGFNLLVILTIALMSWAVVIVMAKMLGKEKFTGRQITSAKSAH